MSTIQLYKGLTWDTLPAAEVIQTVSMDYISDVLAGIRADWQAIATANVDRDGLGEAGLIMLDEITETLTGLTND